ncbi:MULTISPECIES: cation-translocating P-type ATPase [Clostridium]|uniref:Cation-translocating P-type ATPase n=1 Tax=Clostridium cibarium TaxID=2762247 RepID=A0ABR8PTU2_9CLOT|nr:MULTISPECIES: cation-translocating P-type ATPase [Clostridium]MBD7911595.1 cation-translocating P-type ATPase [Clostridium cibarium]
MTIERKTMKLQGLTNEEAKKAQNKYGKNQLIPEKKENFLLKLLNVLKEPMFLLLIMSAIIYFLLGEPTDGSVMLIFVVGMILIDVVQEWKTDKTLKSLRKLSAPHIKVIRDYKEKMINSEDLVPGDLMIITEGIKVPADGKLISSNDLFIDESSLTGEAEGIWKSIDSTDEGDYLKKDHCYAGTLVLQGSGVVKVEKIGMATEYGKIGHGISEAKDIVTPLEKQTRYLVKICSVLAIVLCFIVAAITYLNLFDSPLKERLIESILSGITLAMAMIPEEFPVVLTVFLSMGAWRLAKKQSLVRKLPSVETLGAVSILCVDKTGTITLNNMKVDHIWSIEEDKDNLLKVMGMACETNPYDPMEKAMLKYCQDNDIKKDYLFSGELINEYSFTNKRKMMGHVWKRDNKIIICAKGSSEKLINLCNLKKEEIDKINKKAYEISSKGLRVIAVGKKDIEDNEIVPLELEDCSLKFLGLIGLIDPPRDYIKDDINKCISAGIRVIMITGDNGLTAASIAKRVGICSNKIITGDELSLMDDSTLREKVKDVCIFSRVLPEHKMKIVKAFQENGEVVAMTGDGVNDAVALKYADIGISMGKRGSEISRDASDLILLDDNFSTIVDTVKDGRRIYDNIRKAVGYIFTIHIPIALASLVAPLLKIDSSSLLLLPIHVVLLELIIDPTCSIVLERQPSESDIMKRNPRSQNEGIINPRLLLKSLIQGLVIFIASFGIYYGYLSYNPEGAAVARSMGLAIIILSNIFLVQVNSSNKDFVYESFKKLSKDKVLWLVNIAILLGVGIILYTPISKFLNLEALSFKEMLLVIGASIASVMWYEFVKLALKLKKTDLISKDK